jgi:phosphoserine phosphatase RsbU/P
MNKPVILCVDDERLVLTSLRTLLKELFGDEYRSEIAESAEEGLDIFTNLRRKELEFALVISDYIMPGMKGDEFLIQVHNASPQTLTIMLTGQAHLDGITNAINQARLYRYVPKPWEKNDLSMTIKEAMNSYAKDMMLIEQNRQLLEMNNSLEQKVLARTAELRRKNENITASITYAKRIQNALLPSLDSLKRSLTDFFVFFRPRDIVSGDFYWFAEKQNKLLIIVADCTGHGVPGALMTMLGFQLLEKIVVENRLVTDSNKILQLLHWELSRLLKQRETSVKDGMDIALCILDTKRKVFQYSGAMNSLYYVHQNQFIEIKADKKPIGGNQSHDEEERIFTKHLIEYPAENEKMTLYLCTDGYQDQFGGNDKRKFMTRRFKDLLYEIHAKPMDEQSQILGSTIDEWMAEGREHQTDDITVLGFRL